MLLEHPGARADEGGDAVLGLAVLHHARRDEGEGTRHGELGEHRVVGLLHLDDEGVLVRGLRRNQQAHHLKPGVAALVVDEGVEVLLDSVGVKGLAVGELHPLADLEGVGAPVGRDRPALGHRRMVGAVVTERDETLEEHLLGEHLAAVEVRVQVAQISVIEKR